MLAQAAAAARIAAVRIALLCALGLIVLHGLDRRAGQLLHPPSLAAVPGPAGDGVKTETADARALGSLERSIHRLLRPGEPIFVANPRHDRVTAGDPLLYVILGHPNPTRYDVMQPGLVTTASVQRADRRLAAAVRNEGRDQVARPPRGGDRAQRIGPLERRPHPRSLPRGELPAVCALRRLPGAGPPSRAMSDRLPFPRAELRRRTVRGAMVTAGFLVGIDLLVLIQGLVVTRLLGPSPDRALRRGVDHRDLADRAQARRHRRGLRPAGGGRSGARVPARVHAGAGAVGGDGARDPGALAGRSRSCIATISCCR